MRRMSPVQRQEQILAAACELLESRPAEELSAEVVAAAAGVSAGLVFHYFSTQRELRRAVIEAAAADLLAQMRPDPALSPAGQVHVALDTFTAAVVRQPALYLAVVRSASELSDVHQNMRDTIRGWLAEGLAKAGVPVTSAIAVTLAGWLAFAEEAITTWLGTGDLSREALVELCEGAFRRLLEQAVADSVHWSVIEQVLAAQPAW
jgi:AcrR family transcriptional regulator